MATVYLVEDIKQNGLLEPIRLYGGKIIDGRNRFLACKQLGIEPETRDFEGDADRLISYVISLNLQRRHLNESQRAMVAAELSSLQLGDNQYTGGSVNLQTHQTSVRVAADQLGVHPRTVEFAKKVLKHGAPEVIDAVKKGDVAVSDAAAVVERPTQAQTALLREVLGGSTKKLKIAARQQDVARQRRDIAEGKAVLPEGVFETISIDPPWPYGTQDSYDPDNWSSRVSTPYPEISLEELAQLKIPSADDCVLWLWTTHRFMPAAFPLLEAWGFEHKRILTWVKDRFGSVIGFGQTRSSASSRCAATPR